MFFQVLSSRFSSSWVLPLLHTYIVSFFLIEVVQICPGIPWIKFKSISIGFCKNSVLETRIEVFSVRMALFFEMIKNTSRLLL